MVLNVIYNILVIIYKLYNYINIYMQFFTTTYSYILYIVSYIATNIYAYILYIYILSNFDYNIILELFRPSIPMKIVNNEGVCILKIVYCLDVTMHLIFSAQ